MTSCAKIGEARNRGLCLPSLSVSSDLMISSASESEIELRFSSRSDSFFV